ncbi:ankyrin repeat-containing protein [Tieghemostelium lacteum]|uniref:Ankyrin repeat-containing protein n=1 Tax=Tieghemostelium lacteum TaxID=361077 RepID=A0A152A334_TIELA|nr:ankyrin repeat-containing protein [Tieghemostelium lacteum]|eukprot:KYR00517.1 ankyrin repeat-containing protein [Tieghemostelium lacteum]
MDSFHKFLFECYIALNGYIKLHVEKENIDLFKKSKEEVNEFFIAFGHQLIKDYKRETQRKDDENSDDEDLNRQIHNQLLEYFTALCFFSQNERVWSVLIRDHIDYFANKSVSNEFGSGIPFCFAIPYGTKPLLELLILLGMDINMTMDNSYMMTSVLYGNIECVEFFRERKCQMNHHNSNGDTSMLFAAMNGDNELIEKLINFGENLLVVNNHGFNVFICASFHNQFHSVKLFGDHIRRKYGNQKLKEMIDHKDKDGETSLHISARLGFHKTARVLLELGSEINIVNKTNQTPVDSVKKSIASLKRDQSFLQANSNQQQHQKNLMYYKEELKKLQYIQLLLPDHFKDTILFSKPNFTKMKRSIETYNKIVRLFDDIIKIKEEEISKHLQSLLVDDSKSKKQKQKKKQQQQQQKQQTKTQIINNKNKSNESKESLNNTIIQNKKNIQEINSNLKNIKSPPTSQTSNNNNNIVSNNKDLKELNNNNSIINNIQKIENLPKEDKTISPPTTPNNINNNDKPSENIESPKDFKKEYEKLAVLYLRQSEKFKEVVNRLFEVENYFTEFNESLYSKNEKAEALGIGIAEILGLGLEFLSPSQLCVLDEIHKSFIDDIERFKNKNN